MFPTCEIFVFPLMYADWCANNGHIMQVPRSAKDLAQQNTIEQVGALTGTGHVLHGAMR